jgi:hypothetical protein
VTSLVEPRPTRVMLVEGREFPCLMGGRWNGWAEPLFTREVAEEVVDWLNAERERAATSDEEWDSPDNYIEVRWDGDVVEYRGALCGHISGWRDDWSRAEKDRVRAEAIADRETYVERIVPIDRPGSPYHGLYDFGLGLCWREADEEAGA